MKQFNPSDHADVALVFSTKVGKCIQNFGNIEYLINLMLEKIGSNELIIAELKSMTASRKMTFVKKYFMKHQIVVNGDSKKAKTDIERTVKVFEERNKIAHNPFVISVYDKTKKPKDMGILVIRYRDEGKQEEWIRETDLDKIMIESLECMGLINELLGSLHESGKI
jgi:hypothetical protein